MATFALLKGDAHSGESRSRTQGIEFECKGLCLIRQQESYNYHTLNIHDISQNKVYRTAITNSEE